jgi:hypothetical protein
LLKRKGLDYSQVQQINYQAYKEQQYDRLADACGKRLI